jgi:hypothetical protein
MAKQITSNELAEIVTGLLIKPDLFGELDSPEKHDEFIEAIGQVVANFCGGDIGGVSPADVPENQWPNDVMTSYLSVWPNDSLPSLEGCIWAPYDPDGWEDHTNEEFELCPGEPVSLIKTEDVRQTIYTLMASVRRAQDEAGY